MVGNPANTNALIAMNNAPDIATERFTAMTRLDHNRAMAQLATKTGSTVNDITKMTIWGNHSATQYPDLFHAEVDGKNAAEVVGDQAWLENDVHPDRAAARRGDHRGPGRSSSAASAANAAIDHVRTGSPAPPTGDWVSMAVAVRRQLRRARGPDVVVPVHHARTASGRSSRASTSTTSPAPASTPRVAELAEERDAVTELGLI